MLTPFSPVSLLWTRSRIALFVLALSFIPRPILSAQATVPSNSKIPTILANVDEVSLDLVVRGKKKKAITDLKPEDLAITDNGTAVKITSLRLASLTSNSPSMLALVFDRMDTSAAGNARSIAAKVLKEVPVAGFSLSVLGVTGRLRLYQDFTSDRSLVTRAVQSATEADRSPKSKEAETAEKTLITIAKTGTDQGGTRVPTDQRAIAQMVLAALQDSQRIIQEQHTVPALASLLAVSRAARMLPGRKALLYFSQGSRFDENSAEMLSSIVGAANRSGTSIYTIDVNVFNEETAQGLLASLATR